jgi:hypothetical protein
MSSNSSSKLNKLKRNEEDSRSLSLKKSTQHTNSASSISSPKTSFSNGQNKTEISNDNNNNNNYNKNDDKNCDEPVIIPDSPRHVNYYNLKQGYFKFGKENTKSNVTNEPTNEQKEEERRNSIKKKGSYNLLFI